MADGLFQRELESLINRYSYENGSNTPDFILANYLKNCLGAFNEAVSERELWYGRKPKSIEMRFDSTAPVDPEERSIYHLEVEGEVSDSDREEIADRVREQSFVTQMCGTFELNIPQSTAPASPADHAEDVSVVFEEHPNITSFFSHWLELAKVQKHGLNDEHDRINLTKAVSEIINQDLLGKGILLTGRMSIPEVEQEPLLQPITLSMSFEYDLFESQAVKVNGPKQSAE